MPKQGGGKRTKEFAPRYSSKYPDAATDQNTRYSTFPDGSSYTEYYRDANDYARRVPIIEENPPSPRNKKKRAQGYDDLP